MKHLLLVAGVAVSSLVSAQNIQEQDVTFKYTQLPITPVDEETGKYNLVVTGNYTQKNADSLAAFEARKLNWSAQLNTALDLWEADKLRLDKQYYSSMMVYETQINSGNTAAVAPVRQPYPAPNFKPRPKAPLTYIDVNAATVTAAIKIEGLTQSTSSSVKVELIYEGFERINVPKMVQSGTAPNIKYSYELQYRMPVTVKIENSKGIVVNERVPGCEGYNTKRTSEYKTKAEVEMYWLENEKAFWDECQRNAVTQTTGAINSYLTEKIGYPMKSRKTEIRTAKSKDHDYTDLLTAFTNFQDGVLNLQYKDKKQAAKDKLQAAVTIWEKALTESNLNDKNARIDKNVTAALYVNLMEAYLWMDDFSNAEMNGNKAINMDNKYGRDARDRMPMVQWQKDRYNANN